MTKAKGQSNWVVQPVRQMDPRGCVVACLAMVSGRTYADVKRELGRHASCPDCGVSDATIAAFLSEHGYTFARLVPTTLDDKPRVPWPPAPFADVHIAGVRGTLTRDLHAVVWLRDGRVFDPEYNAPMTLAHYDSVTDVIGVYRVTAS